MKKLFFALFVSLFGGISINAQSTSPAPAASPRPVASTITVAEAKNSPSPKAAEPSKRGPVFRPTKDQIKQVQAMLKEKSLYKGEATGTYNDETRDAIKSFQKGNGLKETGTLNRATLEKMNIALTDSQKAIPVSESSYATAEPEKKPAKAEAASGPSDSAEPKPKKAAVFRATKDQIMEAQKMLKAGSMYAGDQSGKLDDATREGLKKYQEANGLKVTGTLNRVTLEKMGIALTESQKAAGEGQ
jgi:peptidoglycan hydrolase-like protein with peptidoglycan-binding domain